MERVMGIEPTRSAWKADVLPLNYTRALNCTRAALTGTNPQQNSRTQENYYANAAHTQNEPVRGR